MIDLEFKTRIMDIRKEYEKICPMTTWSDEELLDYLHEQEDSTELLKVNSVEEYIKENHCKYAEDIIIEFYHKLY